MVDERVDLCRNPQHNSNMTSTLIKSVQRFLLVDSMWQAEESALEIGASLELVAGSPSLRVAYTVLKSCYLQASMRKPNPSWLYMDKYTGDYAALY